MVLRLYPEELLPAMCWLLLVNMQSSVLFVCAPDSQKGGKRGMDAFQDLKRHSISQTVAPSLLL